MIVLIFFLVTFSKNVTFLNVYCFVNKTKRWLNKLSIFELIS